MKEQVRPLVVRCETADGDSGGYWREEGPGKENIWCEDTQLQDPSTVNTCVMLNRMDKWEGGWNNGITLHSEHVSETALGYSGLCVCVDKCEYAVSEASPHINSSL